jgi:CBS domain-containing protein
VRTLLSWFGSHRRSWRNVEAIRDALTELNLTTDPDFEDPHIDARLTIKPVSAPPAGDAETALPTPTTPISATSGASHPERDQIASEALAAVERVEPAHQISRLRSANQEPTSVKPDATVQEAITIMLMNDYSQLPVMQSEREPKGIFSWKTLGSRLALGQKCTCVRECMDAYTELDPKASLYDAIPLIIQHECVLIRDENRKISGIVTPADLSTQFRDLAEPFLLLGAIENQLRAWIKARFTKADLQNAKDPSDTERQIKDVTDLTFGEYVRLLENPDNWNKLETKVDRKVCIAKLNDVRDIRNDVMHFDPDPMESSELETLRSFAQFLDHVDNLEGW